MGNWKYRGVEITDIDQIPKGTFGFIYEVTHKLSGRKYVGKKQLMSVLNVPLGKKELALITDKRKSKKKRVVKESNWKSYYGSHPEVKDILKRGEEDLYDREILRFVTKKKLLTYYETKELFLRGVLEEGSTYINDNIEGRYFKKDFIINEQDSTEFFEDSL